MKRLVEEQCGSPPIAVKVKWIDGMRFVANDDKGHSIVMDVSKEHGGECSAFSPMQLLLAALGGCTGIDLLGIMRKQRQELTSLEILVSGERVAEHPRVYKKVNVEFRLKGEGLKEKAVQRAIQLSVDTYCSVGATIKKTAQISHSYTLQ
jgi:putative redox protein